LALAGPLLAMGTSDCNRPAVWVISDGVRGGGDGFFAQCRECYKRTTYYYFPETADDLLPASLFEKDLGRHLMCGDKAVSSEYMNATEPTDDPATRRELYGWIAERGIRNHVHREAIEKRFLHLKSWAVRLTIAVALAIGFYAANCASRALHREPDDWVWYGVLLCVGLVVARWILLGRFRKHIKVK
jgi:hypothetical protein